MVGAAARVMARGEFGGVGVGVRARIIEWVLVLVQDLRDVGTQETVGGAAGDFVVGLGADDGEEARDRGVLGLGVEGLAALARDVADVVQDGGDVGLGGPEGEVDDVGLAGVGDFGEAGVVVEPLLEAGFVFRGEEGLGVGSGDGRAVSGEGGDG